MSVYASILLLLLLKGFHNDHSLVISKTMPVYSAPAIFWCLLYVAD